MSAAASTVELLARPGLQVRPVHEDEFDAWATALETGFGRDVDAEDLRHRRAVTDLDRTLAVFEGDRVVATANAAARRLTVPGAVLDNASVAAVSVLPTHRRQGLLTRLMRRQLDDVHARGEAVATLEASESGIYQRFGYGMAAGRGSFVVERAATRMTGAEPACRLRLLATEEAARLLPEVYDRVRGVQPGFLERTPTWWREHGLWDPVQRRDGFGAARHVVSEGLDGAEGYARYRIRRAWEEGLPAGELEVVELVAATAAAEAALWRYLFGVDLVSRVSARRRPVDEPLVWMLADPRRLRRRWADGLWLRLVDLPAALRRRRYGVPGRVTLEVRDAFCPWNSGRWELEGDDSGAACRRTSREPDLVLDAGDLAAAYLGGVALSTLARAGRVKGQRAALRRADLMFSWGAAPWSP